MKTTTRIHASPVSDKNGQRPDTPAGFPARLASRWLDGLIAERGLSRNTVAAYRQDLDALRDFLDELETPLSGLDDENITLFIAWLRKRGDATRTLARRISSLRSFLAWCVERGELASNPAALIDTPKLPSLLPAPLARLHQQWPAVALDLSTGPTQELLERLRAHALDAAFVAWPPGQPPDAALDTRPVFTEELLLALPPGHPAVRGPQDVQPDTLAVFEAGCTYRRMAQEWFAPRHAPLRLLELGSYHAILASVAGGSCAGVVPRSVLALTPQAALLAVQPLATIDTLLVWRRGYRSAALDALLQTLD